MRAIAPRSPFGERGELTLAAGVAMAAAHAQCQGLRLGFPTGDTRERVRLRNALVLTLLAANTEAVVREGVVQLLDGCGHARKFAGAWRIRPSSSALALLLDDRHVEQRSREEGGITLIASAYHAVLAVKDERGGAPAACGGLRSLTAARAVIRTLRAIPPESIQGSAVMNDVICASATTPQNISVRKPRTRRRNPPECGVDLLQASSRLSADEAQTLAEARAILLRLAGMSGVCLTAPSATREYLRTMLAPQERELFIVLALDNRHRLIASDILFAGTIDGASVHPREVVKCALRHNAAAVIFAHNHPSGVAEASQADELITRRLRDALALVDIRTLDHLVVGAGQTLSFAERGLL